MTNETKSDAISRICRKFTALYVLLQGRHSALSSAATVAAQWPFQQRLACDPVDGQFPLSFQALHDFFERQEEAWGIEAVPMLSVLQPRCIKVLSQSQHNHQRLWQVKSVSWGSSCFE